MRSCVAGLSKKQRSTVQPEEASTHLEYQRPTSLKRGEIGHYGHKLGRNQPPWVQNTPLVRKFPASRNCAVKAEKSPRQICFPWIPDGVVLHPSRRKARRTRIRRLQWPPRKGQKIAFRTDFGIQMGVLEEIQQGLFCRQYVMGDGRIAMEHEFQGCVARIKAAHDICQLMGHIALKSAIENERKMVALMETSPSIPRA